MTEAWRKVPASRMFRVPAGVFEASSPGNVKVPGEVRGGSPDPDGYRVLSTAGGSSTSMWW